MDLDKIDLDSYQHGYKMAVRHMRRTVEDKIRELEEAESAQPSAAGFYEGFYVGGSEQLNTMKAWLDELVKGR